MVRATEKQAFPPRSGGEARSGIDIVRLSSSQLEFKVVVLERSIYFAHVDEGLGMRGPELEGRGGALGVVTFFTLRGSS